MKKYPLALLLAGAALVSACLGPADQVKETPSQDDKDGDTFVPPFDCDDNDPLVHPGANEVCGNGKDDDCDGKIDAADPDCKNADCIHPDDCDGDHYAGPQANGPDCNDADATVHPGANEVCDGKDNNCNGQIDEGCQQQCTDCDGDGFNGQQVGGPDCNDQNKFIYPGQVEICNGVDDNCNGQIDEGCGGSGGTGGSGGSTGMVDVYLAFTLPQDAPVPVNKVLFAGYVPHYAADKFVHLCDVAYNEVAVDGRTFSCTVKLPPPGPIDLQVETHYGDIQLSLPSKTKVQWACYELKGEDALKAVGQSGYDPVSQRCIQPSQCWRDWGTTKVNGQVVATWNGYAKSNGSVGSNGGCNYGFSF
ncbi:hypothetical protein KJZ71_04690 [Patescibacteria group bacterium]|uniref:Uncharacterized protein n=1 Tax=candidate division WWE3 bacterium TaxID=2053526 RepID=A0A928TSH6_UNCKA|nr:hypothetical protein [candidate division WWE3 bacterium]MCL4733066.1 hypothetical protein [Patescibacteria group bacterium]MDL1953321.1 hypothetical protein [Candidatus Uhrbacteria bacterium UHB]RIL00550.1 MAG: hypothetical protein DCC77_03260 [Candidatus Uhrbacteria bacterium]